MCLQCFETAGVLRARPGVGFGLHRNNVRASFLRRVPADIPSNPLAFDTAGSSKYVRQMLGFLAKQGFVRAGEQVAFPFCRPQNDEFLKRAPLSLRMARSAGLLG